MLSESYKNRLNKLAGILSEQIKVERFSSIPNDFNGSSESVFYTPQGEGNSDFGQHKTTATISDKAKLYKYSNSYEYAINFNLMDIPYDSVKKLTGLNTLREVEHAYDEGKFNNPNKFYWTFQQIAKEHLQDKYDGIMWASEDESNPVQYQIWNKEMILQDQNK